MKFTRINLNHVGYNTLSPSPQLSKADLDIHAIHSLLKFPSSTKNEMAQLYYKYGRAAVIDDDAIDYDMLSLQEMALAKQREKYSPYDQDFEEYHRDKFFSNQAIMDAFNEEGKWGQPSSVTREQRSAYLVSMMQYSVVVEYLMGCVGAAQAACRDGNMDTFHWDSFAAMYIGSMEGHRVGGSDKTIDGYMLFNLANKRAVQFKTLTDERYSVNSVINDEMLDLLFAGQSELARNDCINFEKSTSRVLHLMLLPLIQSTIWYAIRNEELNNYSSEDLAIGEVFAMSVLPIVAKYDPDAAEVIQKNMIHLNGNNPTVDGAQDVANAFFQVLDEVGWGCEYIGQAEGVDACQLYVAQLRSAGSSSRPGFVGLTTSLFLMWVSIWSL